MTSFEKSQPPRVFVHAGRLGYMIGVNFLDNPYKQEPFRSLWEKGWRMQKNQYQPTYKRQPQKQRQRRPVTLRIPAGSRFEMQPVR